MKKRSMALIVVMTILTSLLSGCNSHSIPVGNYMFEDVAYVGLISSATRDYLVETKSGTEYIIGEDYLTIKSKDNETTFSNISFEKQEMTDDLIEENYSIEKEPITDLFSQYKNRYRYSLFDESGEQIYYYIFLLDKDIFICQFAKNDMIIFSIDKITLQDGENER